jgi:protein ImuB
MVLYETYRGSRRVACCSAAAKALGVGVGMPFAEAATLAGSTCLHQEGYEPSADRKALEELAVVCGQFSPVVGLDDAAHPDGLLLDVTGLARLFGSEASLAAGVVDELARRGLTARVAVADTIGAAWAVAHFDPRAPVVIVPPGETSGALAPLPVEALRLPEETVGLLHQLGVYQIGQLERLPREDLTSRFGPPLLERLDQATGQRAEPVLAHPLPPELFARQSLEHPTGRRKTIQCVLESLIARVARKLARCGCGAVRLDCRLKCPSGRNVDLSVGLFQPSASPRHLYELVRMRLERVSLSAPVSDVHVEAAVTAPLQCPERELFADRQNGRRRRRLAGLVDRLTSRLGDRSVLRARLVRDAQPELACRCEPLVKDAKNSPGKRSRRGEPRRSPEADLLPRPLRLLARPIGLVAVAIMPDGPPLRFHFEGREHRVVHTWGPERIETGWWRGRPVRRDYYRVETTTGRRYWIFRELGDGRWFLHGTFE